MKVVNFDQQYFEYFLHEKLNEFSNEDKNCLVVGIKEGGIPLAEMVVSFLEKEKKRNVDFVAVKCQRPTTKTKKKSQLIKYCLQNCFKFLPQLFLNQLRIMEHHFLIKKMNHTREVELPFQFDWKKYQQILVVDDAVDSGYSIKKVLEEIKSQISNQTDLLSLTVVVTNHEAIILPDYYLYSDVLIRFPWSLDGKESRI